jgi:hypothetical protein
LFLQRKRACFGSFQCVCCLLLKLVLKTYSVKNHIAVPSNPTLNSRLLAYSRQSFFADVLAEVVTVVVVVVIWLTAEVVTFSAGSETLPQDVKITVQKIDIKIAFLIKFTLLCQAIYHKSAVKSSVLAEVLPL